MKPISTKTKAALFAARDRLLAGKATKSDGRLTIANLAAEAGVSRATVYRAPNLARSFQATATSRNRRSQAKPARRIAALEAELAAAHAREAEELRDLRALNNILAQQVQALTLKTIEQQRHIAGLQSELSRTGRGGTVVALGKGASA